MSRARFIVGDTREVTAAMPDGSVDLILTSPPFLALRSYLPADHPDKALEIGSEVTPADFLDVLLELTVEWRAVLAPHGSICIELGDTYSGSGGAGGGGDDFRQARDRANRPGDGWPLAKSLCMIPQLYSASLAYGRNLLNPDHTIEPWRVRNIVRWCRPNPPVGALGDKFRPGTSEMTVACMARDRYFDLDAVRTEVKHPEQTATTATDESGVRRRKLNPYDASMSAGAPPLDWWEISTEAYPGSHYATWPRKLLIKPILAMCPQRVCTVCGEPSRRITDRPEAIGEGTVKSRQPGDERKRKRLSTHVPDFATVETLGWTDCGHDAWRNGLVLDPFAGSGTTLAVATGHGRDAIGIDFDARNADLAQERVGMFLTVEHHERAAA